MNKDFINHLIKNSDLTKTDYFIYKETFIKEKCKKEEKLIFKKLEIPNFKNYIIFDFKTTGPSPYKDKILEISAIKILNNNIIDKFNILINPKIFIPPFISSKINITNDMVKDKPYIEDIFNDFIYFLGDYNLVIHNANFCMEFLIINSKKFNINISNAVLDTASVTKILYPDFKRYNLTFLCKHFNIENDRSIALSNIISIYDLYKILYNKNKKV